MKKKNLLVNLIKIFVSGIFLFLVIKKIDFSLLKETLKNSEIFILFFSFLFLIGVSVLLALRWYLILKIYLKEKNSLFYIWKLTMVGLFFNMLLPTSAGGDAVKIYYLVKEEEKKLLSGISVIIDRYIGSLTVITMGAVSLLFSSINDRRIYYLIFSLFLFLLLLFLFFSSREFARKFYNPLKKLLPVSLKTKLENLYSSFHYYFSHKKNLGKAILISFLLQTVSILAQYVGCFAIIKKFLSISIFFIYIPLIWLATIIPSIGGLGIREFSYVYFFSPYMGKEKAFALSLIFLFSLIIQSFIGFFIFITLKERG